MSGTELYPVAIVQDRYGGVYSGGQWLAIAEADKVYSKLPRTQFVMTNGPSADDVMCLQFWSNKPDWIAVGNTPDEAYNSLVQRDNHEFK